MAHLPPPPPNFTNFTQLPLELVLMIISCLNPPDFVSILIAAPQLMYFYHIEPTFAEISELRVQNRLGLRIVRESSCALQYDSLMKGIPNLLVSMRGLPNELLEMIWEEMPRKEQWGFALANWVNLCAKGFLKPIADDETIEILR
jgi:hypothetical protein